MQIPNKSSFFCILAAGLLGGSAAAQGPTGGYATRLVVDGHVSPGGSKTITGRGAPPGDGIWVELWKNPAAGGPPLSVASVQAMNGSFSFQNVSVAEGDSLYATLSRSWLFSSAGSAEGWDGASNDVRLSVANGVLRVEVRNLDGDAFTDAYFQNSFTYDPEYHRVVEVRLRNPAPLAPSNLLGIFWGAPFGTTICEHNAAIPSSMTGFQTILIPMNVGETRIAPGPAAGGMDGLWAAGSLNNVLRFDPLNNIPPGDNSLDGTTIEIDWIRIREDYRRDFHAAGDLAGLDAFANISDVRVAGGFLSYSAGSDPFFSSSLETGPIESRHFTRMALGMEGSSIAVSPNEAAAFFDDRDSAGYRDNSGSGPLQRAALPGAVDGRRDLVWSLGSATAGEWSEDGAVRAAGFRLHCPEVPTQGDEVRLDYVALIPEAPFGPSLATPASLSSFEPLTFWDFLQGLQGWTPNHFTAGVEITPDGLELDSTGEDPWITSPAVDCPAGRALRASLRMKSTANSSGQLFYGRGFSEEASVRFTVKSDGSWQEYTLAVPPQGGGTRFRLDPASGPGHLTIAWFRLESVAPIVPPALEPPERPRPGANPPARISSGDLEIVHYRERWGGFVVNVSGAEAASSHDAGLLGFYTDTGLSWKKLQEAPVTVSAAGGALTEQTTFGDAAGGTWTLRRSIRAGGVAGSLALETSVQCDRARSVLHIPWLTLFPGLGTHGGRKHQGLFAGLEYLADEPSSSEADLTTPEHVRRIPDPLKITFPLMAVEDSGRYVGVTWELSDKAAAVYDSPDRIFGSESHIMALWAPNVGDLRPENSIFAQAPFSLSAGAPLIVRATLLGGEGGSTIPAVQQYVALKGLPGVPSFSGGLQGAVTVLAAGWLDSDAYAGDGLWRHAVWSGFNPQKASDAIAFMLWLANHTTNSGLEGRLRQEAALALDLRLKDDPTFSSGVSHVHWPINSLLFGNVAGYVAARRDGASSQTGLFDAAGIRHYPQGGAKPELGATHFADHASGYGASVLQGILEAAALSGSSTLLTKALALLELQTGLYGNAEPRGAQTWEVPLHTPDVLASAYLLKSYLIGYELTGNESYLAEARYWAWTGVPFVYLEPWYPAEISRYATIPVYGATNFVAPVWIGLPVQWCGLVYRSWIQRLALHDPEGPWETIAKGITACGLQMTWPQTDAARQGLLPDVFRLKSQSREGPAINPGTVQGSLAELYSAGSMYGFQRASGLGWFIHAPCAIEGFEESPTHAAFSVEGWGPDTYRILVSRVTSRPPIVLSRPSGSAAPYGPATFTYDGTNRWLVVEARGDAQIRVATRNAAPRVQITSPADGTVFAPPARISMAASAVDDDGTVARVAFLSGGQTLSTDESAPYAFVWDAVPAGNYTLIARATDNLGSQGQASVTVTVAAGGKRFIRGDANSSGVVDLSDAVYILNHAFLGGPPASCLASEDANRDGAVDISDPVYILNFLFLGGPRIPEPYPSCGSEAPPGPVPCAAFGPCGN